MPVLLRGSQAKNRPPEVRPVPQVDVPNLLQSLGAAAMCPFGSREGAGEAFGVFSSCWNGELKGEKFGMSP